MNEDRDSMLRQDHIRLPGEVFPMKPETVPECVQGFPYGDLGSGVLAANPRHVPASLFGTEPVGHCEMRRAYTASATRAANLGGTALPICFAISIFDPLNQNVSGND